MIIYKCSCGDELIVAKNTEGSRAKKKRWKQKHGAPLIEKSPRRKIGDMGGAGIHGYVRLVTRARQR